MSTQGEGIAEISPAQQRRNEVAAAAAIVAELEIEKQDFVPRVIPVSTPLSHFVNFTK